MKKKIAVIDGKGGGIGKAICESLSKHSEYEIIALGTNAVATASMMKGGAKDGATGENAITVMANKVDFIVGPISILSANAMMGEITERMAIAISGSEAEKILLPLGRCGLNVVGTDKLSINDMIDTIHSTIENL